ncbi:MAG: AmmeMemoRadiSam system protein B [bacterium]
MRVHKSVLAGSWYPAGRAGLEQAVRGHLAAQRAADTAPADRLIALVVPHAGYRYSGATAASGFSLLTRTRHDRIILLGPSHSHSFRGLSLGDYDFYETPLGRVPVDRDGRARMAGCPLVSPDLEPHVREHAIDVELPFLQVALKDRPFTILPLLVGDLEEEDYAELAAALAELVDERTVAVISSDFTHYGPRFGYVPFPPGESVPEAVRSLDAEAWETVLRCDRRAFLRLRARTGITVCGYRAIAVLLEMLPQGCRGRLLSYSTSADVTGDLENTVSYVALAFFRDSSHTRQPQPSKKGPAQNMSSTESPRGAPDAGTGLSPSEKETLLRLARDTLESYVRSGRTPDPLAAPYRITDNLKQKRGAFVTLKKGGELRGCIGYIQPIEPVYAAVQENTINAAARDSRFPPVEKEELASLRIEISVLSQPKRIASYEDIALGTHGIILKKGLHQSVFLPQVAPEQGWDLPETLRNLSLKAGLPADAWRHRETTFSIFTAEILDEF